MRKERMVQFLLEMGADPTRTNREVRNEQPVLALCISHSCLLCSLYILEQVLKQLAVTAKQNKLVS
jgi:Pyruvate/2-oxoacid:ferredoxin oxidoreductase delta subunit